MTSGSHKRVLILASGSFTVAGGAQASLALRLSSQARGLLRRTGTLRSRVTMLAHDPTGAHHTTIVLATLHNRQRAPDGRSSDFSR